MAAAVPGQVPVQTVASDVAASRRAARFLGAAGAIELMAGLVMVGLELEPILLLPLHVLFVAILVVLARRHLQGGGDTTAMTIGLTMIAALGPLGAIASALSAAVPSRRETPERLAEWYERIALATPNDPVARLAERVAVGRTMNLDGAPPGSFTHLMRKGSLVERQAALGLIARKFHPDYLPALRVALRSPEPVIRVQAAAVAARIQPELKQWLLRHTEGGCSGLVEETDALLREMRAILASGLVDGAAAAAGREAMAALAGNALPAAGDDASAAVELPAPLERIRAHEDLLISSGRLRDLRRLRGRYRVIGQRACRVRTPGPGGAGTRPRRQEHGAAGTAAGSRS